MNLLSFTLTMALCLSLYGLVIISLDRKLAEWAAQYWMDKYQKERQRYLSEHGRLKQLRKK